LLNFDRKEPPAVPRHAATVVVVRQRADDESQGLEVFCVLRHPKSSFLGGAVVFPGGKVDPADSAGRWDELATEPHPRGVEMVDASHPPGLTPRAIAVAACRETLEEACIIPLDAPLDDASVGALRLEAASYDGGFAPKPPLMALQDGLAAALARRGLRLAVDRLVPWARWVTPEAEARRFDARFFLLELPPGQVGRHDDHETTMSFWARPAVVLDRAARGDIFLAPPTTRSLELLATVDTVTGAFALAAQQCLSPILPVFHPGDQAGHEGASGSDPRPKRSSTEGPPAEPFLALPGDPMHPVRQRRVAGPTRFVLRDGRFVGAEAPTSEAQGGRFT
jgi:8-oxo-dGTP pyrophosphatase MutT (NUDIX family)